MLPLIEKKYIHVVNRSFSFFFSFLSFFFSDDRGIASDRKLTKPGQSGSDEGNFCIAMLNLLFTTTTTKALLMVI